MVGSAVGSGRHRHPSRRSLPHPHPGEHDREMPWWKWAPLPQFVKDVPHARVSRHCASKDPCDVRTGFAQEELLYLEDSSGTVRAVRRGADVDMHFQAGVAPSAFLAGWLQDPKRAWAVWDARVRAEHPDGGTIYVPLL